MKAIVMGALKGALTQALVSKKGTHKYAAPEQHILRMIIWLARTFYGLKFVDTNLSGGKKIISIYRHHYLQMHQLVTRFGMDILLPIVDRILLTLNDGMVTDKYIDLPKEFYVDNLELTNLVIEGQTAVLRFKIKDYKCQLCVNRGRYILVLPDRKINLSSNCIKIYLKDLPEFKKRQFKNEVDLYSDEGVEDIKKTLSDKEKMLLDIVQMIRKKNN